MDEMKEAVQRVMPPGYDRENGDWWYGKFDKTGTTTIIQGCLQKDCIVCHKQADETDYLFSTDVLEALKDD
jgi:hypothetical protein